jgi:putative flippase GtrA
MQQKAWNIAFMYSLFAGVSTLINLGTQIFFLMFYQERYSIELSILVGTIAGLPLRYFLEKKYIFNFQSSGVAHDSWLFFLYGLMGVITTAIFWCVEYTFHWVFYTDQMRYLGGIIGLTMGFYFKYHLDKKFVFENLWLGRVSNNKFFIDCSFYSIRFHKNNWF